MNGVGVLKGDVPQGEMLVVGLDGVDDVEAGDTCTRRVVDPG